MREFAELMAILALILAGIFAMLCLISLPLALIGWGVSAIVGLFTPVNITYMGYVAVGVGTPVLINFIRASR